MSGSRESSPDWLRSFKVPTDSPLTLSSDSESLQDGTSASVECKSDHEESPSKSRKLPKTNENTGKSCADSLKPEDKTPTRRNKLDNHKKIKGTGGDMEVKVEETTEKHVESNVPPTGLPLLLSEKVHRTKALAECEGDSIDLSGDIGAVGRVIISDTSSVDQEMCIDLKGTIYKTSIVPSRTFCIVSLGQSEAKVDAIMNDFMQLKPQSNLYEAETMVEGTLDGFSFDSDEEANKLPKATSSQTHENGHADEPTNGKVKGRADKTSGVAKKRSRSTGGKPHPQKKIRNKTQGSKKAKTKK